jgi:hypothetical protein
VYVTLTHIMANIVIIKAYQVLSQSPQNTDESVHMIDHFGHVISVEHVKSPPRFDASDCRQ